jgi:transposase
MKVTMRQQYSWEFKRRAVQESIDSPETVGAVAARLGVPYKTLESWRAQMTKKPVPLVSNNGPEKSYVELERENRRLRKQLEKAELKNEILKKANEYFDKLPK